MNNDKVVFGTILRAYVRHEMQYKTLYVKLRTVAKQLLNAGASRLVVVVWDSDKFRSICDYGGSYNRLCTEFQDEPLITVLKNTGDNFVDGPNFGMHTLQSIGCTHGLMASMDVQVNASAFFDKAARAIEKGAHVIAVPVEGTEELVRDGFVNNAWCLWNIQTLTAIWGFDHRDRGPAHTGGSYGKTVSGYKPYAGVGECLVLPPIKKLLGRPFLRITDFVAQYPATFDRERHSKKNESKRKRIDLLLADTEYTKEDFKRCILS